ncbi:MAG TPA: hypothetical protein VMY35_11430 [Phycisphaerae bacterium]|nr:hypothetical protein [Phycisphaerae bacterium]
MGLPFWLRHPRRAWRIVRATRAIQGELMMKSPWRSRTLWVNVLALAAMAVERYYGSNLLDADTQTAMLAVINVVLRLVTRQPVGLV